jgi:hypothetical protein
LVSVVTQKFLLRWGKACPLPFEFALRWGAIQEQIPINSLARGSHPGKLTGLPSGVCDGRS